MSQVRPGNRVHDADEISIFDAEKYFSEGQVRKESQISSVGTANLDRITDVSSIPRLSSVSSADGYGRNYRIGSFNATPTASSEASWNSQAGLLSNPPGSISVSMRNLPSDEKKKGSVTARKWFSGQNCPCSGKKSVQVEERSTEPKTPVRSNDKSSNGSIKSDETSLRTEPKNEKARDFRPASFSINGSIKKSVVTANWAKEDEAVNDSAHFPAENGFSSEISRRVVPSGRPFNDGGGFSFPILNPPAPAITQLEDPPRESLEVFRPSDESTRNKSTELRRSMLMPIPGKGERRSFNLPASPRSGMTITEDDIASDASSDLFEIESFSTQTTSYPNYLRQESLDEISSVTARRFNFRRSLDETMTPSVTPTECYEPSEASIDWSVTTAEGFDRGSVTNFSTAASDYEDVMFIRPESEKVTTGAAVGNGKRRGNGMLSCRCEKAVNVGPQPVKFLPEEQHHGGVPVFMEESDRIPVAEKFGKLGLNHMPKGFSKPPPGRSQSARMARAFRTQ